MCARSLCLIFSSAVELLKNQQSPLCLGTGYKEDGGGTFPGPKPIAGQHHSEVRTGSAQQSEL